jgi:hypothetical protein
VAANRKKIGKKADKGDNGKIVYSVQDKEFQNEL